MSLKTRPGGDLNDDRFTFAAPTKWLEELRLFARRDARFKGNVSGALKAGADLLMSGAGQPSPNEISFELSTGDRQELEKLADDALKIDDANLFAKMLIRRMLDLGPDVAREVLLGQVQREVAVQIEEENQTRAGNASTTTTARRTRKAA